LQDLEAKLEKKEAGLAVDKARYSEGKRNLPAAMEASTAAARAVEGERDTARNTWLDARDGWLAAKKTDPSRWKAEAVVFILSTIISGSSSWFVGKFLGSRDAPHIEALQAIRARRRLRHSVKALTKSRKGQEGRARIILARFRAAYMAQLESSGRFSPAQVRTMTEKAFGRTSEDAGAIIDTAVAGFRDAIRPDWRSGWHPRRARPVARR
jgi:hypothetical protein